MDNQAFFDAGGKPLESLRVFNLVRYGNEVPLKADGIEDVILTVDIGSPIVLPETVNAIMTDGSTSGVPVTWNVTPDELAAMEAKGEGKYEVTGTADGRLAKAYISIVLFNYLENDSFEQGDLTGWVLTEHGKADELYVEEKLTDSLTGSWHMHYWSAAKNSVEFTLEQPVTGLESGTYKFNISIMGGDCGETDIYAFVKVNGEIVARDTMTINGYGNWDAGEIRGVEYTVGDEISVGIYVKCQGSGNGAWGKIDDAKLNKDT